MDQGFVWCALSVARMDFKVPELPADSRVHIKNFRQSDATVLMETHIEGDGTSDALLTSVILVKFSHPLLSSDYGSGARMWPSISLN